VTHRPRHALAPVANRPWHFTSAGATNPAEPARRRSCAADRPALAPPRSRTPQPLAEGAPNLLLDPEHTFTSRPPIGYDRWLTVHRDPGPDPGQIATLQTCCSHSTGARSRPSILRAPDRARRASISRRVASARPTWSSSRCSRCVHHRQRGSSASGWRRTYAMRWSLFPTIEL